MKEREREEETQRENPQHGVASVKAPIQADRRRKTTSERKRKTWNKKEKEKKKKKKKKKKKEEEKKEKGKKGRTRAPADTHVSWIMDANMAYYPGPCVARAWIYLSRQ